MTMSQAATPAQNWGSSAPPAASPRAWRALIVLLIGMFMALLDTTIVNVALPTIRDHVNANGTQAGEDVLSWIISGYALAFGIALIPAGRLGDRFGHKWVFFGGLALFTAASLACGLAQSDIQLIVFRVIQGLAGGIFVPAVTAYIQILFPGRIRGRAFAIMGAVLGVSSALGPIVGGLIIQAFGTENGWRLVFGVNVPIGIVALILAVAFVPSKKRVAEIAPQAPEYARTGGVDWIGLLLITGGLVAILVPLIEGQDKGWPLWTFLTLAGGVVLIVLFALWEISYTKRGRSPLVPPHLFSHPAFSGGTILAFVYFAAFTSIFFTISLLWQAGLGHTALESGLVSVPFAIGSIIGSAQSNRLSQRLGRNVLVIGTGLVLLSLVAVWLILLNVSAADITNWDLLVPLFFGGLGNGLFIAPNAQFIVATVDSSEAGAASGVISTMQRVGAAVGIAVIGSVLFGIANLSSLTKEIPNKVAAALAAGKYTSPAAASHAISKHLLATHFMTAAGGAMAVSAIFALVAFGLVFMLPRKLNQWGGAPASH
ncbi:MAG TPA: MFS transporter [Galbitalea sp.]|jgi:EmrB/QacA subfamily drug resistance transporter|nr:MFS transporter [Galbitalea sp.]